ncbi:fas-associated death domain protein [Eurosta solidaginis]|uniref:fas-associated death domain protein n=1 Tax=Eurosta solidaginis TaxID=178769 RepID=UPI00353116ED
MENVTQYWSYDLIKDIASREPPSSDFINELKSMFIKDIGSPRRYECIRTMADLIDCLERRDSINEQNVEPLRLLDSKELNEAIDNYTSRNALKEEESNKNQYHYIQMANEMHSKLSISDNNAPTMQNGNYRNKNAFRIESIATTRTSSNDNTNPTANAPANSSYSAFALPEQKRAAIYKMLSLHLGTHWRSFGRELDIREGALDEIELQYPRELSTRVYKVMKTFEEDDCHDPKMDLRIIKEALERARRKDLRRKVDDIMSH